MSAERIWILLARKKSGEATVNELDELKALLAAQSVSGFSNEIIDRMWDAPMQSMPENNMPDDLWQRIEARVGANRRIGVRILTGKWMAAASILLAVSVAVWGAFNYKSKTNRQPAQTNMSQVSTQPGSKSKLELPDGTQVWLNGNSRLTYGNGSFGKEDRVVVLTGEAFFDVAKNEKIPFIIHTGPVNITVMGTAFNVKAYPREKTIETSLVRGLVEITMNRDPDRRILLKPNEKIIIPVDEARGTTLPAAVADSAGAPLYSITKWKSSDKQPEEIAWVDSQLVFDDEPLSVLAPRLEKWYHITVQFRNEEIKNRRFSGVIENEPLKETLEALQISYPFNYELKGNVLWIGDK